MERQYRTSGGPKRRTKGTSDLGFKLDVLNLGEIWCRRAEQGERSAGGEIWEIWEKPRAGTITRMFDKAWRTTGDRDW